jgi:FkbM family methyltransferase
MNNALGKLAMQVNFFIRRHPSRWLYTDRLLGKYVDLQEAPYLERCWGEGVIWDVGASVGKYTGIISKHNPRATIYAFEPNLNSLYYLAYRTARFSNVVIVPNALTADGNPLKGSHDPDFNASATGPMVATLSLAEAIRKFGAPVFVKMDIEGGEFQIFESEDAHLLNKSTILVSWHPHLANRAIQPVKGWKNTTVAEDITLLEPL